MDIEKILKLGELGFTAEQIKQLMDMDTTSEAPKEQPEQVVERSKPEEPKEVIKEVEQPQIDYAKLAEEIALRQQRNVTINPEPPKVEAPPVQKSVEEITLGLLN